MARPTKSGFAPSGSEWTLTLLLLTLVLPLTPATPLCAGEAEEILKILQARDARFDNLTLTYTMSGTEKVEDYSWKFRPSARQQRQQAANQPARQPLPNEVAFRHLDQMTIRGPEITFYRLPSPDLISDVFLTKSMKWNNIGGVRRELVLYDQSRTSTKGMMSYAKHLGLVADGEAEHRMCVELTLGFGYGKRLSEVKSMKRTDAGIVLEGTIRLWREDVSHCVLELNDDYVVRKAVIDCDVHGNLTHFDVSTLGSVEKGGFMFAKEGHWLRRWDGRIVDGRKTGTPKITYEYDIAFEDVQFDLTDAEYQQLSTIEPPLGVDISDPDHLAPPGGNLSVAEHAGGERWRVILFINAIGITLLLFFLWVRSRRRARFR